MITYQRYTELLSKTSHRGWGSFFTTSFLLISSICQAHIGVEYQMELGDPSNATSDPNNHEHHLIQRNVLAEDYDDEREEPNWVDLD